MTYLVLRSIRTARCGKDLMRHWRKCHGDLVSLSWTPQLTLVIVTACRGVEGFNE